MPLRGASTTSPGGPGDRSQATRDLDRLPPREVVARILEQDAMVAGAVAACADQLGRAVEGVASRLRRGGRLFYVGAGTSGRLAVLDAAEVPATYGTPSELVQVILAGGERAFLGAVEGAEDDAAAGAAAVRQRARAADAVVGVAASGTTPFTVAALAAGRELGCLTVAVTAVPSSPLARRAEIAITPETGPEVVMGSTRMKAGTAQKMVLNALSTGVMVVLGRVYSNLMVEMPASNEKLRRRAARMVELAAGVGEEAARRALDAADGEVKRAVAMLRLGLDAAGAGERLARHDGDLRAALGERDR
ncbi:MAG TPA: N-acetylmuramic acid 6-phosphate etherase [Thermoanaerobaculia bacterium]|nr:N-acetylmuramic acid 6-phosphate etherase [Thermoanaerobaculia bacterium]